MTYAGRMRAQLHLRVRTAQFAAYRKWCRACWIHTPPLRQVLAKFCYLKASSCIQLFAFGINFASCKATSNTPSKRLVQVSAFPYFSLPPPIGLGGMRVSVNNSLCKIAFLFTKHLIFRLREQILKNGGDRSRLGAEPAG